jgi:hypothetical protein
MPLLRDLRNSRGSGILPRFVDLLVKQNRNPPVPSPFLLNLANPNLPNFTSRFQMRATTRLQIHTRNLK